jgi:predicted transcriptional regulator
MAPKTQPRLPNGVAERAIIACLSEKTPCTTAELCKAVTKRARRKVHQVTVAQALTRLVMERKVEKVAHGLYMIYSPHMSRLLRACMHKPIWRAIAKVFDKKGDPFMRMDDLLDRVRTYPAEEVQKALAAMARKDILEIKPYAHFAGEGKEGKGVGLTMRYWRPDQLPPIERPADTFRELYGADEPADLADLLS